MGAVPVGPSNLKGALPDQAVTYLQALNARVLALENAAPVASPAAQVPSTAPLTAQDVLSIVQSTFPILGSSTGSSGAGLVGIGTHAQRVASYPASSYSAGAMFFETDRGALYTVIAASGGNQWQLMVMAPFAGTDPPALTQYDSGFTYVQEQFNRLYVWGGTSWADYAGQEPRGLIAPFFVSGGDSGWALCDGSTVSISVANDPTSIGEIGLPDLLTDTPYLQFGPTAGAGGDTTSVSVAGGATYNLNINLNFEQLVPMMRL